MILYLQKVRGYYGRKKLTGIPSIDYKVNKERVYGIEEDYSMYDIDKSMFEYFVDCVYDKLDDTMIEYLGVKITYKDMIKMVYNVARSLQELGIQKGSYVVSIMPNTPEVRALIYACSLLGATIHPIDPRTNKEALKKNDRTSRFSNMLWRFIYKI